MSNSNLASYIDTTTPHYTPRAYPISRITIHHAAGRAELPGFSSIIAHKAEGSWNYAIANSGKIGLFVEECNRAWTSGNYENDHRAVTIEVSNSRVGDDWPVSDEAYKSIIDLCEDICRRNNIPGLVYTGRKEDSNLTMHCWFQPTGCPGPYLKSKFADIAQQVNKRLGAPSNLKYIVNPEIVNSAYATAVSGAPIDPMSINTDNIDEFVLTLNRNSGINLDYDKLKSIGVIGSVLEGGYLYDSIHREVSYRNPNLGEQINNLSKYDLPFGLYFDVKSKSIDEANKELYYLSLCVRKYSPLMGVWLRLKFNNTKTINEKILDRYYKKLVDLGLKDKVGLYVTKSELNKIDWENYMDNFYLWVDSHISSVSNINELETPQFFVLDNM